MYKVVVAPVTSDMLTEYAVQIAVDNGIECALRLADAFDEAVESLRELPQRGVRNLSYIPARYHVIPFWKHLWLVYQIQLKEHTVYMDYLIDDRSDYGRLFQQ
ncbi:type II toxin-antitoxin system RelE/ParE family toxin [Anaerolentibacter hominis]|uniref:type II toxin-antitoxin system RelE/ParE family toxin n=1 Tax=Anaerolentibacter hominis TaxID=3079009 RepID=UPI0031B8A30B